MGDRPCVGAEPKPEGARLGRGDEEGRVLAEEGPAVGAVDQGVGHSLGEVDLEARGPVVADQIDQGRGPEGGACRHGWEDPRGEEGDPGRVGEDLAGQAVQEEGEGGPASHLKQTTSRQHLETQSN